MSQFIYLAAMSSVMLFSQQFATDLIKRVNIAYGRLDAYDADFYRLDYWPPAETFTMAHPWRNTRLQPLYPHLDFAGRRSGSNHSLLLEILEETSK